MFYIRIITRFWYLTITLRFFLIKRKNKTITITIITKVITRLRIVLVRKKI